MKFFRPESKHDRFLTRRKSTCCRVLIRKFQMGSPEHIQQCIAITGEVAADVIEAMASHRPYRPSLGIEPALKEIERGRGSQFDPEVVDAIVRLLREKGYSLPQ